MYSNFIASLYVSVIAMGVIFLVLILLIYTVKILVHFLPYQEPPSSASAPGAPAQDEEHIAVITSAVAAYLGKSPEQLRIVNIKSI